MKYSFKVNGSRSEGYWAECIELDGCMTQGETYPELEDNMQDALNLYLSEPEDSKHLFPLPSKKKSKKGKSSAIVQVQVNATVAVAMLFRQFRVEAGLSVRQASNLVKLAIGDGASVSHRKIQDIENPNKPVTTKTLDELLRAFPDLDLSEAFR